MAHTESGVTVKERVRAREVHSFEGAWRFWRGDELEEEVLGHGNLNLIANETRIWQKAGNHAISSPDNPYVDGWRQVDLPHDFVLEGTFTAEASLGNGSLPGGQAWYVKKFDLPAEAAGQRVSLEFDGVYRDCSVFCNGHFVGRHLSGYTSFEVDLSELCQFGAANAVAVQVDARENELWSYEGGGIYRAVRLVITNPVHVPQWGAFVRTGDADDPGRTEVELTVCNQSYAALTAELSCQILAPDGTAVADSCGTLSLEGMDRATADLQMTVENPHLWSLEAPTLYTLVAEIRVNGEAVDQYEQRFGYRYCHFDGATGFYLNGMSLKLKGTCCHQDSGCVGVAVPAGLQAWRVARLKSYGCNAIRTSHNPPDPALLTACDELGMLVMDELRVPGIAPEILADAESVIRRDRNHPSVILWSIGNEEMKIQNTDVGVGIFRRIQHLVHRLDPSRATTYGCNCNWIDICDFQAESEFRFDVWGANYRSGQRSANYDDFHAKHPDWPMLGAETWGGASTRGLYEDDGCPLAERWVWNEDGWADERRYVSAEANWCTPWGYSIEEMWQDCASRPFMAGTFVWTGFDYRGETSPYAYPAVITRYGVVDLCGFYKPVAHYLRSWWRRDEPHIFLMPHWNWEGREGQTIRVRCYANAASVELFCNGTSLSRQEMPENGRLEWNVPYAPGELVAVGYDSRGAVWCEARNRTAGSPAAIELEVEQMADILVVNATIVDEQGTVCPRADNPVAFSADGPVRLLGVGNGNPISHEADQGTHLRKAYHGLCQAIYQRQGTAPVRIQAQSEPLGVGLVSC